MDRLFVDLAISCCRDAAWARAGGLEASAADLLREACYWLEARAAAVSRRGQSQASGGSA